MRSRGQYSIRLSGCQANGRRGSGSFCQRSFTELVLRLFAEPALRFFTSFRMTYEGLRVTAEGVRMTSLACVILEPFGPERASRAGSAKGKNLNSCRALARKSQTDPLPFLRFVGSM